MGVTGLRGGWEGVEWVCCVQLGGDVLRGNHILLRMPYSYLRFITKGTFVGKLCMSWV